ncbi:DUF4326 domain-containing protein [Roseomonas xinghualingensis]|uniref:DUF4326 domain-containing protein n=1 Tax=Roseomonas xinghualingensis TaxID=2986475 RepID=UPI003672651F
MRIPEQIQPSRKNGWRMPPNTVKADRPTRFGNPFTVERLSKAATPRSSQRNRSRRTAFASG